MKGFAPNLHLPHLPKSFSIDIVHTHKHSVTGVKAIYSMIALGASIGTAYYVINWIRGKRESTPHSKPLHELLFFPDDRPTCKALYMERQGCHDKKCRFSHDPNSAFSKLMRHLLSARQTLDLCVFCFTSPELADAVITLKQRGVRVRLVTDNEQVDASNTQVGKFRSEGILVRHNRTSYLMHHKFAIIDNTTLINGSFNWTRQAVMGNNENVLVTTDPPLVTPFINEFNKLWSLFNPEKIRTF